MSVLSTLRRWLGMEARSDVYNPTHPRDGALRELFGGGMGSSAGVMVTMESAVGVSAVYAAARVLAETIGSVPLVLFQQDGRDRRRATDDPLHALLSTKPNPEMTSAVFRETLVYNAALGGNALAEIEFNNAGRPMALWPLLADRTRRVRSDDGRRYLYVTRTRDGQEHALEREQVLHVPIASATGLWGRPIVELAADAIGAAIAAQDFSGRFFSNGLSPSGFFKHPKTISAPALERWKASVKEWNQGLTNAHRFMILEEGMEWQTPGISPEHAQLIETRKFQVRDVARWFRMPPHMIQDLENATFTNIEHQSLEFVKYTMLPWFTKFEQEFDAQLLDGDDERFFGFVLQGLLRGDHSGRAAFYQQLLTNGVLSPNEVRELEDLNPRPGGDRFMRPLNAIEIDEQGNALPVPRDPAPAPRGERDLEAFRPLFDAAARRFSAKESAQRGKLAGREDELRAWIAEAAHRELAPLLGALGVGDEFEAVLAAAPPAEWFERACALAKEGE
jgi:HK97 family phage portal protein